jgi:hypothetical protein
MFHRQGAILFWISSRWRIGAETCRSFICYVWSLVFNVHLLVTVITCKNNARSVCHMSDVCVLFRTPEVYLAPELLVSNVLHYIPCLNLMDTLKSLKSLWHCYWRFKSSNMWCCVRRVVADVWKERNVIIFTVKPSNNIASHLMLESEGSTIFRNVENRSRNGRTLHSKNFNLSDCLSFQTDCGATAPRRGHTQPPMASTPASYGAYPSSHGMYSSCGPTPPPMGRTRPPIGPTRPPMVRTRPMGLPLLLWYVPVLWAYPSSYGTYPSSYRTHPSSYRTYPSSYGAYPSFYGTYPSSYGSYPSFYVTHPASYGVQPASFGAYLSTCGAYASFYGTYPTSYGAYPASCAVHQAFYTVVSWALCTGVKRPGREAALHLLPNESSTTLTPQHVTYLSCFA